MSSLTISMTEIVLRRSPHDASGDQKRIFARQHRDLGRVIAHQVFGRGSREHQRGETVRHVAL
jgi:hypothetical protein